MPDVLIKDVPEETLRALTEMAARRGHTLQDELLQALERLASHSSLSQAERARRIRESLAKRGREFSDSAQLIREDRGL